MKVALIKPPATYANWYKYPAFNLACINTYIKFDGFNCKTFNSLFYSWSEEELLAMLNEYKPDIARISAMTSNEINSTAHIASYIKNNWIFLL